MLVEILLCKKCVACDKVGVNRHTACRYVGLHMVKDRSHIDHRSNTDFPLALTLVDVRAV